MEIRTIKKTNKLPSIVSLKMKIENKIIFFSFVLCQIFKKRLKKAFISLRKRKNMKIFHLIRKISNVERKICNKNDILNKLFSTNISQEHVKIETSLDENEEMFIEKFLTKRRKPLSIIKKNVNFLLDNNVLNDHTGNLKNNFDLTVESFKFDDFPSLDKKFNESNKHKFGSQLKEL